MKDDLRSRYDADELVDVLKITPDEIVDRFEDRVEEYLHEEGDHEPEEEI